MGLFGDSKCRKELNRVKEKLFGYENTDCLNVFSTGILGGQNIRITDANQRVCQITAVLLNILPKKDLDKKLDRDTMRYGEIFPESWFDDNDKATVRELLENIDP